MDYLSGRGVIVSKRIVIHRQVEMYKPSIFQPFSISVTSGTKMNVWQNLNFKNISI